MNGLETIKQIRKNNYNNLVFGITGDESKHCSDFIEHGVDCIISKPLTNSKIERIITFIKANGTTRQINKKIKLVNDTLKWV